MIGRILLAVILSGIAAGLVMGLIQHVRLTPLILQAETFEHIAQDQGAETHSHDANWTPANGLERTFYTTLTAMISSVGFGLLLVGVSFIAKIPLNRGNAWIWGLCGFAAVSFAPAMGFPPQLPGAPSAEFTSRVLWWGGAVVFTTAGLVSLYVARNGKPTWYPATALLLLPHLFPIPQVVADTASKLPVHIATQFVTASLAANLIMWLVLATTLGFALLKFEGTLNT